MKGTTDQYYQANGIDNVRVGYGFDSQQASFKPFSPLTSHEIDALPSEKYQPGRTTFKVVIIENKESFLKESELNVGLAARYAALKVSGHAELDTYLHWTNRTVSLYIYLENYFGSDILKDIPSLSTDAQGLLHSDRNAFVGRYGDSYISERIRGSRVAIMYVFTGSSEEEKNSFKASLQGSVSLIAGGGSFETGASQKLQHLQESGQLQIDMTSIPAAEHLDTFFVGVDSIKETMGKFLGQFDSKNQGCLLYRIDPIPGFEDAGMGMDPREGKYLDRCTVINQDLADLKSAIEECLDVSTRNALQKKVAERNDFLESLNSAASDYFLGGGDASTASKLDELFNKRLSDLDLPNIWQQTWWTDESVDVRGLSASRKLINLPSGPRVILHIEGSVTTPRGTGNWWSDVRFDLLANGIQQGGQINFIGDQYATHAVKRDFTIRRPSDGILDVQFRWGWAASQGTGELPIIIEKGFQIAVSAEPSR